MKKNLSKILSLMLIAVMIFTFAACGSNGNSGDAEGPVSLSIATGGTSGTAVSSHRCSIRSSVTR